MPLTNPKPSREPEAATSTDDFLGGRIKIVQPRSGHRAGSDAVFLAAAVLARPGDRVLDAGAGVGVAGLCVLTRSPEVDVTAVEIDERLCALAMQNAEENGVTEYFRALNADITAPGKVLEAAGLVREGYDHVMANPPFYAEGAVRPAPDAGRAVAHVMPPGELENWIRFLATMTAPKGTVSVIHRADRLGEILPPLQDRFGDIAVFPLFPKAGEPATRVIVQGRKGSRGLLRLLSGLILHGPDGGYTDEVEAVLRGGEPLRFGGIQLGGPQRVGKK